MAMVLTDNLKQEITSSQITPTLIVKIDGYPILFGNVEIKKYIKIGDPNLFIDGTWLIGGFSLLDNQAAYISFSQGTTTRIAQKLDPARGQSSSVSQMTIALLDYYEQITELVSPDVVLSDVIGRAVTVFFGAQETSWPEDYNVVFRGVIQDVEASTDTVFLNLASTDEKKRTAILPTINSNLSAHVDYRSGSLQDLFFANREDVANTVSVTYIAGGTAGSEGVSVAGYNITVQIANGLSTAAQIKKAIENDPDANQLVEVKIDGISSDPQFTGSVTLSSDNTIDLVDASEFILPTDVLRTYVIIGDELMEYTGKTGNQLTGVTRAQFDSVGEFHEAGKDVKQVLRLTSNGIDLALKLMLSNGPTYYAENLKIKSIEYFTPSESTDNCIFFDVINLAVDYGVSVGDLVTVTLDQVGANNITDGIVLEVGTTGGGSYCIVSNDLQSSPASAGFAKFKSQYNVLPIGCAMVPAEVDVDYHQYIKRTFISVFGLDIFTDQINDAKSFLEKEVYQPMTCFSVPRKGRSSLIYTIGPVPNYEVVTLNASTVENPEKLRVKRSSNENFFNQVQFDYDYDPVSGKYLTHKNYPFEPDQSTIPVGTKPYILKSQGLRSNLDADERTLQAANRWLRRYATGAEFIKGLKPIFSIGYQTEIGDIVAVDYASLKLSDFNSGTRSGPIKLMEVMNKILDNKTGEVTLDLVNTAFGFADRYAFISPSTKVGVGSTTSKLIMQKSWSTKSFEPESKKWDGYIGQPIIVHSEDWSISYDTFIRGFDNAVPQGMSIDPVPTAPLEGWVIQCPNYPSSVDPNELAFWKQRHCFFTARVGVVAGVSNTQFTVGPSDVGRFFIGSIIRVHNYGFTIDSGDVEVTNIIGNDIVVSSDLGFVPSSNEFVDLIGFPDKTQSYRVI